MSSDILQCCWPRTPEQPYVLRCVPCGLQQFCYRHALQHVHNDWLDERDEPFRFRPARWPAVESWLMECFEAACREGEAS